MANWKDPEFLRYVSLTLVGVVLLITGVVWFRFAGQIEPQIPALVTRATENAPEAIPTLQAMQAFLPTMKAFSMFTALTGLMTLVSGALAINDFRKRSLPAAWAYAAPTEVQQ